ncbi:MAG: GIY-YIG nuclease family protein [Rickettsiales bacterium]|nr:GIY-YIG nuclease family protein [Rickettsiales bacterium]
MFYVYILQSINSPEHFYVGFTNNLRLRFDEHNFGKARHTNKYKPWKLRTYFAFSNKEKAEEFEKYLKSHAGRNFQKKYL